VQNVCYEERETIEHVWNGCSEMREREGKEWEEILNEDGRETGWMICRGRIERGVRIGIKNVIFGIVILFGYVYVYIFKL
jgi:hypothetical protein